MKKKRKGAGMRIMAFLMSAAIMCQTLPLHAASGGMDERDASGEAVKILPCDALYTVEGIDPLWPKTVQVEVGGKTEERRVKWNFREGFFTEDRNTKAYQIEGDVEGTSEKALLDVFLVRENMVYMIDCGAPDSPEFKHYTNLQNTVADQPFHHESGTWGYTGTYRAHAYTGEDAAYDMYETGWEVSPDAVEEGTGGAGDRLEYVVTLGEGEYTATFGFCSWDKKEKTIELDCPQLQQPGAGAAGPRESVKLSADNNYRGTIELAVSCEEKEELHFSFLTPSSMTPDPAVSFIQIQKKLDLSELKNSMGDTLRRYLMMDSSALDEERLGELKMALEAGHRLFFSPFTTQEEADKAVEEIRKAEENLEQRNITAEDLKKNDYVLYTVNCGTDNHFWIPEGERPGLLQSAFDQKLEKDRATGYQWGCDETGENGQTMGYRRNVTPEEMEDVRNSCITLQQSIDPNAKNTLGYAFELPKQTVSGILPDAYEVTVGFQLMEEGSMANPWGAPYKDRPVQILLEGKPVVSGVTITSEKWECRSFTTQVKDGILNVQIKNPDRKNAEEDPVINYIRVRALKSKRDVIPGLSGELLYDTKGMDIRAYGGEIHSYTEDGKTRWYWIGEDGMAPDESSYTMRHNGIHMYSSEDLYEWEDEGVVLRTMETKEDFQDPYFQNLYGGLSAEEQGEMFSYLKKEGALLNRPKMIYDGRQYVIWFTGVTMENQSAAGVAVADSIKGPYRLVKTYDLGGKDGILLDLDLLEDADGKAYLIYSLGYHEAQREIEMFRSELKAGDYTLFAGDGQKMAFMNEEEGGAPEGGGDTEEEIRMGDVGTVFRYGDAYYMFNAGKKKYAVTNSLDEAWKEKELMLWDGEKMSVIDGQIQSSGIIPVHIDDEVRYIHMGDNGSWSEAGLGRHIWLPIEFLEDKENPVALRALSDWRYNGELPELPDAGMLQKEIEEGEKLIRQEYTAKSWQEYQQALDAANRLMDMLDTAVQKEVDDAADALQMARNALVLLKDVFDDALNAYQTQSGKDSYEETSWSVYERALQKAQELRTQGGYTEDEMNAVILSLREAFGQLKPAQPVNPSPEEPDPEKPDPEKPDPEEPGPEKPDPEEPGPEKPGPEEPGPEKPDPEEPGPEKPEPEKPGPEEPDPVNPSPEEPEPEKPDSEKPEPEKPNPTDPGSGNGQGSGGNPADEGTVPAVVKVSRIFINGTIKTLARGKKTDLQLTVLEPNATNKGVIWSSSNPSIAEVNSGGMVTGKGAGKAVITATAVDGSGVSGSYAIQVVKHSVKKIIIKSSKKKIAAGKKVKIKATIKTSGKTANRTLEWKTSNENYATVNSKGIVTAKKAGKGKTVTIMARATDGSGKKDTIKIRIK